MNLNFRRTALLVGICSAVSLTYTPQLFAASVDAIDAVQQAKKITGTVTDAMGPVIGANVLEKGTLKEGGYLLDIKGETDSELLSRALLLAENKIKERDRHISVLEEKNAQNAIKLYECPQVANQ